MQIPPKKWLVGAAVLAAALGLGVFVAVSKSIAVKTARIEQNIPVRVFGLGTVEAQVISKVGFEVGGALIELKVDHGDRVKKGDVIARLHDADQSAKVARTKAGVMGAEVAIRKSEASLAKTRAILAQKTHTNRRRQELVARQTVSVQTAEEAQTDVAIAAADLAVAEADIEVLKASLADVRAQYQFEQITLDHYTLLAPFDAVIVERLKEAGTVVKAGDPIFTLVAPETVWVLAHIDESRSGPVTVGQTASVRLRSLPQKTFKGRVARIGIESDRVSEERRVWVSCEDCPPLFHLGEQAEVLITVGSLSKALLVPEAAVQGFDGFKGRVWTIENGRLAHRQVAFGMRTEDARLEITTAMPTDVRVVAQSGTGLVEGRSARIVDGAP